MSEVVFFLEERSAKVMLEGLLPRLLPAGLRPRYLVFEGKQDLDKQLVRRLRGYRVPDARFVVLRDKDASDCVELKRALSEKCAEAGRAGVLIRIVCHELESWYLADLAAVGRGLQVRGLEKLQNKRPCMTPDLHPSPCRTLQKIAPSYQKVGGSRAIGPHLDPDNARSPSFAHFVSGLRRLVTDISEEGGNR